MTIMAVQQTGRTVSKTHQSRYRVPANVAHVRFSTGTDRGVLTGNRPQAGALLSSRSSAPRRPYRYDQPNIHVRLARDMLGLLHCLPPQRFRPSSHSPWQARARRLNYRLVDHNRPCLRSTMTATGQKETYRDDPRMSALASKADISRFTSRHPNPRRFSHVPCASGPRPPSPCPATPARSQPPTGG